MSRERGRAAAAAGLVLFLGLAGAAAARGPAEPAEEPGLEADREPRPPSPSEPEKPDWIGRLVYAIEPVPVAWALRVWGEARLWLVERPDGRLEGGLEGSREQEIVVPAGPLAPRCSQSLEPAPFAARLDGHRPEPDRLVLVLRDPRPASGRVADCGPAPGIRHPGPLDEPALAELLAGLRRLDDGSWTGRLEQVSTGGGGPTRLVQRYELVLRPQRAKPEAR
jgi:hypothetical protein